MTGSLPHREESIHIETDDGLALAATTFVPESAPHGALLISSGTGIPRRFYARFAARAAARGLVTLTYDYRGIADSVPGSIRGYNARYRDWGQLDIPCAIAWLRNRYPEIPLYTVGHSTGGQQLGLAHNVDQVKAAVFVTVSTGYWRGMPPHYKFLTYLLWNAYMPLASRIYGYAPAKKIRFGENLPVGVAKEWGDWCLEPEYMAAFFDHVGRKRSSDGRDFGPTHFDRAAFPIRSYYFTDDPISTRANVPPMLALYAKSTIEQRWFEPKDLGAKAIGHLGFFRSRIGTPLWDEAID